MFEPFPDDWSRAQQAAACVVGVDAVEFLDHPDGTVEYGPVLRRDIAHAIRRHRPELVLTANYDDAGRNTPDHRAVGRAAVDAVGDAGNRWLFPEPGHAVDIGATVDRAVASLRAHEIYPRVLGGEMGDPGPFLRGMAEEAATRLPGATLATAFELMSTA